MRPYLPVAVIAIGLLAGLVWAGWLAQRHVAGAESLIDRVETVLLDWRILVAGTRDAPDDVVIVAIDDETIAAAGAYPIGREALARLIGRIGAAGARALAVDILLVAETESRADLDLADALRGLPAVIAGAAVFAEGPRRASPVPAASDWLMPRPEFADAAHVGLVNVASDAGGTPRHVPMLFETPEGLAPSFGLRAAALFVGDMPAVTRDGLRLGDEIRTLDMGWHLPFNYYGPAGSIETVSAKTLLEGAPPAPDIEGRLVVLGVTATGVGDRFSTPFDPVLPGVELQATGIANLLDGSALVRGTSVRIVDAAVALALTGLGILAVALLPLATASVACICLLAGWLVAATLLFLQGYWFSAALPLAAGMPPVSVMAVLRQAFDRYETRKLVRAREALSRFQAPALAARIASDPAFLLTPREQDAAILFVDLTGYVGLSERLGPARTRDILKAFHTLVVNEAARHGGLVLDFMGDGAMLGFGIPDAGPADAANACRCAFGLARSFEARIAAGDFTADMGGIRVGGHFGPVVLSRLGHENQQQIAATGDCVNVANRLQEVAKSHHASIALSVGLVDAADRSTGDPLTVPCVETSAIRGRREDVEVGLWTAAEILAAN